MPFFKFCPNIHSMCITFIVCVLDGVSPLTQITFFMAVDFAFVLYLLIRKPIKN